MGNGLKRRSGGSLVAQIDMTSPSVEDGALKNPFETGASY